MKPGARSIFCLKSDKKWRDFMVSMGQLKITRLQEKWMASHLEIISKIGKKKSEKLPKMEFKAFFFVARSVHRHFYGKIRHLEE